MQDYDDCSATAVAKTGTMVDSAIYRYTQRLYSKRNMVYGRDPMPELTITSPYFDSRVGSNTFTMGYPITESTLKVHKIENFFTPILEFALFLC